MQVAQTTQPSVINGILAAQLIQDVTTERQDDGLLAPPPTRGIQPSAELTLSATSAPNSPTPAAALSDIESGPLSDKGAIAAPPISQQQLVVPALDVILKETDDSGLVIPDLGFILDQGDDTPAGVTAAGAVGIITKVFKGMIDFMKFVD